MTHIEKGGGLPRLRLQLWARTTQVDANERVMRELTCMVDLMFYASTFDRMNARALAGFEVLTRRFQTILDAYKVQGRTPNWQTALVYCWVTAAVNASAPELRQRGAWGAEEEFDLGTGARRARGLASTGAGASAGEEAQEGDVGGGPRGRGRGRGGGRAELAKAGGPAAAADR